MAILTKGTTFATGDDVTPTKLNNLVDDAAFVAGVSGSTDNSSLEVNGSGRLQVKDSGISSAKIAAGAVTNTKLPDSTLATDGVTYAKLQRVGSMKVIGNVAGGLAVAAEVTILDENDMASDSATALATQQSIKSYVDGAVDSVITLAAAQATTSGTSIDFSGLPSTIKRITIILRNVSTNGTSNLLFRLGAGSITTSGYTSSAHTSNTFNDDSTAGILLGASNAAGSAYTGHIVITNMSSNTWVASYVLCSTNGANSYGSGEIALSGTLDRVRLTTEGGVNTFDAGSINIMYE